VALDPVFMSRLQFAWVMALHILLPAFTVGLAAYIAVLEGTYLATRRPVFLNISKFWIRIFAVSFGMGVVSGIVMAFQIGTNWSRYADLTGNALGPLFAYEALTAFFLEAAFLGILLFGRKLVPPWMHFFSALMVAGGTLLSSFWILAANSWMQTPTGYEVIDGRFFPKSWIELIFNPSFPYRLMHTLTGFFITTAFVVIGVAAYYLRNGRAVAESRTMQMMGLGLMTVLVPLQMVLGDQHGLNTLEYQPAKIAAIEANWETQKRMPLLLFALPDEEAGVNHAEIAIPVLGSLILTHDANGIVKGLREWPREDRPPVAVPFFSFRIMVGIGLLMFVVVASGWWLWLRGRLLDAPWFQNLCIVVSPLGFIAVVAGWVVTEVGRQPWIVYGLLRTRDAVSPSLTGTDVTLSLLVYVAAYLVIFGAGFLFIIRLFKAGPAAGVDSAEEPQHGRAARPLSAAEGRT
jgi:cytochrome d ubiquinol oxidase subunit I